MSVRECVKEPVNPGGGGRLSGRALVLKGICPGGGGFVRGHCPEGVCMEGAFVRTLVSAQ